MGAAFVVAAGLGVACGVGGLYLSYYVNVSAGAAIAGLLVGTFLCAAGARAVRVTAAG